MDRNDIKAELDKVQAIVRTWNCETVPEVEKDIVLSSLAKIYSHIKFNGVTVAQMTKEEALVPSEPLAEHIISVGTCSDEKGEVPCEAGATAEFTAVPELVQSPQEISPADCQQDEMPRRSRVDRKVLMSLYNDAPVVPMPENGEKSDAVSPDSSQVEPLTRAVDSKTEYHSIPVQPKQEETASQHDQFVSPQEPVSPEPVAIQHEKKVVLGDVINNGEKTISDAYNQANNSSDVATRVSSGMVTGLKSAIGINDKFLFIRDLFNGDHAAFDRGIEELERFSDLNDALIHIYENYDWDPDSDAVKLLVDILTRKLS